MDFIYIDPKIDEENPTMQAHQESIIPLSTHMICCSASNKDFFPNFSIPGLFVTEFQAE